MRFRQERSRSPGRFSPGRASDNRETFIIVIVFVAAEKYEISRCLVAGDLDGYDNRTNGSIPLTGREPALRMATQLGAFVVRPAATAINFGS
jgi:hypothetical protein